MITLYNEKDQQIKLISTFEFTESDMGESSISATVLFDAEQDFHPDWYVVYNGERFRLGVRKPTGRKDTSSLSTSYTLVFKSEREDLKRYTFMDFVELGTDNPQPNSYNVPLYATLTEFVDRFNVNLRHYMGDRWAMVLPEDYVEDGNAISMSFDNVTLWDVLLQVYEIFGVRWVIREVEGVLQIQVGFPEEEIEHIFEYGKDNGLVSIERNNSLERIVTRLRGRGSEKNLPPDYFHTGDADTTPELQAMYFKNLMPKVFRDYIRGYKAGEGEGTWAYNQGVADKVAGKPLNPVDYVISENEDLWGVSYGAIKPNEKIFPTLQGATRDGERLDEVVFVEEVLQDGVAEPLKITNIGIGAGGENTSIGACGDNAGNYAPDCTEGIEFTMLTDEFSVDGEINTVSISIGTDASYIDQNGIPTSVQFGAESKVLATFTLELLNTDSVPGEVVASYAFSNDNLYTWKVQDVAPGKYRFRANVAWSADIELEDYNEDVRVHIKSRLYGGEVVEYASEGDKDEFKQTFDIEIKDVWGIAREEGESDEDYTYRVWGPLAVSEEMSVMFSDGLLAGEDYEFRIAGFTIDSDNLRAVITNAIKPIEDGWRLTPQKSDVEIDAGGKYLPNTMQNAKAGDHFFFINIAMPYDPYVYDAEARVDADLHTQLSLLDEEFPSFTISPSKIFCSTFSEVGKLQAGAKIRIRNAALIGDSYTSLYIQSLTKRYSDKSLNPEWNITVSDQIVASGNPVSTLEGNVKILSQQVYNNRQAVKEAIRAMSSTFLRKDGISDVSYSPTEFAKKIELGDGVVDKGFNRGDVSGKGFGVYTDSNGNRVVEADILVGRIGARFNEVKINQVTYSGGKQVFSAAGMVVSKVVHTADGWQCFFDTKQGSEQNLFEINDGAFSQRFSGSGINQYWARVIAIGPDYITISKTDCMSENYQPFVGDNIAQLGNSTNKARQAAIVIDVVRDGGGLITWYDDITGYTLNEKDSINIGRVEGKTWLQVFGSAYIGARDESEYVKYENGKVTIKGKLEVGTTLADGTDIAEAIRNATPEGYDEFVEQVTAGLGSLQQQIDGAIESYFYEVAPTLENEPAIDWDTTEEKEAHLNDTYTNLKDGRSWRWTKSDDVYGWTEITDTATAEALRKAGEAQDTADGKRRVFITEPTTPYDEGDLWAAGSSEPLKRCISSRESGDFNAEDWDYADNNSELASQIAGYEYLKKALKESTTIDGGMIQSSILVLGYTDADGVFHIMSGTNGIYDAAKIGGGIAAWYGGDMVDAEDGTGAQSLFRFDGSGYLAGGNIRWDKKGAGAVAGGDLSWDEDGNITLGNGIKITADGDETLGSLLIALSNKYDKSGGDIEGDANVIGKLSMGTLVIPNAEGVVGEHTLMIGEVGAGAATPEGGGSGTADFSQIKVYDTNGILLGNGSSSGKITIVPYPVVPTDVSTFNNDAGYLTSHQDISGLATKTELENKVDKVDGKGLSTEDFTTELKTKLQGLSNYDDTAINNAIKGIQDEIDTLVSGDAATAIESFNEIIAFLDGVEDTETLEGIIAAIEQQIASKVSTETFNALATRVGTAETNITNLGTRADGLQGNIEDLQDDVTTILDDYLSKANGGIIKGAVTIQAALKMNILYLPNSNNTPSDYQMSVGVLGAGADTPEGGGGGIGKVSIYLGAGTTPYDSDAEGKVVLPPYPTAVTESTVSGWGFTKNTGTYSKPSTGIPKTDLASAVQTSLGKADTALQEHQDLSGYQTKITFTNKLAYSLINGTPTTLPASDVYAWAKKSSLAASDVPDLSGSYLSRSGGTLTSASSPLVINRTSGNPVISYKANGTTIGALGFDTDGNLIVRPNFQANSNYYDVIHSGNIGSQKAGSANILATAYAENINYAAYTTALKLIKFNANWETNGFPSNWTSGLSVMAGYGGWQLVTYGGNTDTPYFRKVSDSGVWSNWRALAFTDSDITGNAATATKLQTARTIWGQSFDGTTDISNATITIYKNLLSNTRGWARSVRALDSSNNILGQFGFYGIGDTLNYAYIGNSHNSPWLLVNSSGKVLIGATTDNGGKLQVEGNINVKGIIRPRANWRGLTNEDTTYTLGTSSYAWGTVYTKCIDTYQDWALVIKNNGVAKVYIGTNYIRSAVNGETTLGTASNRWNTLYGTSANFSGNVHLNNMVHLWVNTSNDTDGSEGNFGFQYYNNNLYITTRTATNAFKASVGRIEYSTGNVLFNNNLFASGYQLPTSAPSNPVSGGYYLYVGTLGTGATIS